MKAATSSLSVKLVNVTVNIDAVMMGLFRDGVGLFLNLCFYCCGLVSVVLGFCMNWSDLV